MRVGIIDSGIDLCRLYDGSRHGYDVHWIPVTAISFASVAGCDLLIIPTGTDLLHLQQARDILRLYRARGGWIYCFDGPAAALFGDAGWTHSPTQHRLQTLHACDAALHFLLEQVALEQLSCKEGVRGWWCEGELHGVDLVPLIVDGAGRVIAASAPRPEGAGMLLLTAAARLPLFSDQPELAANRLFANLLDWRRHTLSPAPRPLHLYLHSGNWAQSSFLASARFGQRFHGVHWSLLDASLLAQATSIWVPWESNTPALKIAWPLLDEAIKAGATLVVEDLRDDWIPGVSWQARPVDSNWWREGRPLALQREPALAKVFGDASATVYFWHYHGVFQGPVAAEPLLTAPDGQTILALLPPSSSSKGQMILGTLDATFEYGAGKIPETADFIAAVLQFIEGPVA